MSVQNVSSVNSVNFKGNQADSKDTNVTQPQNNVKDGKKKLALALAALGAAAVAGVGIAVAIKKNRISTNTIPTKLNLEKFKQIGNFEKGNAYINGKTFTGTIEVPSKDGAKTFIEYVNGVMQSSIKKSSDGVDIFKKTYQYGTNNKLSYVKTEANEKITEFIKTKSGHVIKENGLLKKALRKNEYGSIITADFENGKPIKSIKYCSDGEISSKKEYLYNSNGKLKEVDIYDYNYKWGNFEKPIKQTYTENGSIKVIDTGYRDKEKLIKEVKVKADGALPYDADVCVYDHSSNTYATHDTYKYYKNGKLKFEENVVYDSIIGSSGNHEVGLQNTDAAYEYIDVRNAETGEITHKRVYDNGACDIARGGQFCAGSEIEHIDANGKTTGFSRITTESSRTYLDSIDENFETNYKEELLDLNGNVISVKHGSYTNSYCRFMIDKFKMENILVKLQ